MVREVGHGGLFVDYVVINTGIERAKVIQIVECYMETVRLSLIKWECQPAWFLYVFRKDKDRIELPLCIWAVQDFAGTHRTGFYVMQGIYVCCKLLGKREKVTYLRNGRISSKRQSGRLPLVLLYLLIFIV